MKMSKMVITESAARIKGVYDDDFEFEFGMVTVDSFIISYFTTASPCVVTIIPTVPT